ncbi:hypothetical protein TNCV_4786471 [Trichonephila clavipes]|nr:hypothetical protein TNCV_4786471 [Trichonephila clavipes]
MDLSEPRLKVLCGREQYGHSHLKRVTCCGPNSRYQCTGACRTFEHVRQSMSRRCRKNPEGTELAKNGHQHDRKVAKLIAKNDANSASFLAMISPSSH